MTINFKWPSIMNIDNTQLAESESLSFSDFLAILKRRFSIFAHTLIILTCITIVLAFGLPAIYESTGTILIEEQNVPEDLVRSAITSYADERIQVISQRVMSTDNLVGLVQTYYPRIPFPNFRVNDSNCGIGDQRRCVSCWLRLRFQ